MGRTLSRIVVSATEPSGDELGARTMRALREAGFSGDFVGLGGPRMRAEGLDALCPLPEPASGFLDVIPALPLYARVRRLLEEAIARFRDEALFLAVDSPDFHDRPMRVAAESGMSCAWLAPPQAWAWRASRADALAARRIPLGVLFPFEERFFRGRGCAVTWLGHPLAATALPPDGEPPRADGPLLLLPGSRPGTWRRNLRWQLALRRRLVRAGEPAARSLVVCPDPPRAAAMRALLARLGADDAAKATPDFDEALASAGAAICCPGTASLRVALAAVPLAVTLRMDALSWAIASRAVRLPHAALPNLVLGEERAREVIFGPWNAPSPDDVAREFARSFEIQRPTCAEAAGRLRAALGGDGYGGRAVAWLREVSDGRLQGL